MGASNKEYRHAILRASRSEERGDWATAKEFHLKAAALSRAAGDTHKESQHTARAAEHTATLLRGPRGGVYTLSSAGHKNYGGGGKPGLRLGRRGGRNAANHEGGLVHHPSHECCGGLKHEEGTANCGRVKGKK